LDLCRSKVQLVDDVRTRNKAEIDEQHLKYQLNWLQLVKILQTR